VIESSDTTIRGNQSVCRASLQEMKGTMEKTTLTKITKIAIAIGFGVVICGAATRRAFAGGGHGGDHGGDRHHEQRHGGHDRGHDHGDVYVAPLPSYYYAPPPNYYYAPEPQYYYPPQPNYYAPPPPSEGINLFFGSH
jgi:hypothetical protein